MGCFERDDYALYKELTAQQTKKNELPHEWETIRGIFKKMLGNKETERQHVQNEGNENIVNIFEQCQTKNDVYMFYCARCRKLIADGNFQAALACCEAGSHFGDMSELKDSIRRYSGEMTLSISEGELRYYGKKYSFPIDPSQFARVFYEKGKNSYRCGDFASAFVFLSEANEFLRSRDVEKMILEIQAGLYRG